MHFGTPEVWVIVKGCGKVELDYAAYGAVSLKLLPVVKTLMYGEPCSTPCRRPAEARLGDSRQGRRNVEQWYVEFKP